MAKGTFASSTFRSRTFRSNTWAGSGAIPPSPPAIVTPGSFNVPSKTQSWQNELAGGALVNEPAWMGMNRREQGEWEERNKRRKKKDVEAIAVLLIRGW